MSCDIYQKGYGKRPGGEKVQQGREYRKVFEYIEEYVRKNVRHTFR